MEPGTITEAERRQADRDEVWQAELDAVLPVGRPRTAARDRTSTAIRFHPDVYARLHSAAAERDLSMNYLVNLAVTDFLDRLIPVEEIKWTR